MYEGITYFYETVKTHTLGTELGYLVYYYHCRLWSAYGASYAYHANRLLCM